MEVIFLDLQGLNAEVSELDGIINSEEPNLDGIISSGELDGIINSEETSQVGDSWCPFSRPEQRIG